MKKYQRVLCLVLVSLMLIPTVFGCSQVVDPDGSDETKNTEKSHETNGDINLKVVFLNDGTGSDGGWGQAVHTSAERVKQEMGFTDEQFVIMDRISAYSDDAESIVEICAQEGYNIIFATSSGFQNAVTNVSKRYPDVYFALHEGEPTENVVVYSNRDHMSFFLTGYALARMSEQDVFGFVGNFPQPNQVRGLNSMAAGAKLANENAVLKTLWNNSWYDPTTAKEAAITLLEEGCDVIFTTDGTSGVPEACEDAGAFTNGTYNDKHLVAPGAVVTSAVILWDPIFIEIIERVREDRWVKHGVVYMGIEEGANAITSLNADIMPREIIAECEELRDKALRGELKAFIGPLYDNKGNLVLEGGKEFTRDDYISMRFFLDNVIGEISD